MKNAILLALLLIQQTASQAQSQALETDIPNPQISFSGFQKNVDEVEKIRATHRITEDQFLRMMVKPGVVILDARSGPKFALRHIRGAINLSLPDFNETALTQVIPNKNTTVLIYCNNNFENSPVSFASKSISTALNLHTFVSLRGYGYTEVFELGPLLDVRTTRLPFEGSEVHEKQPPTN